MSNHQSPFQTKSEVQISDESPDPIADSQKLEVIASLKQVIEPVLNNDIISLGMVRNLRVVDNYIYMRLYIGKHQFALQDQVKLVTSKIEWCKKTYVELCTIPGVRTTLAISSGKGGVGKSTTSVNLAAALQVQGFSVGILDADVYGPNVPKMMGLKNLEVRVKDTANGQKFLPLEAHGIKVMSVGLLAEPDHPLAWRGPVLHKIITQFIQDVDWGDLDFLLIDLPPGTGDAQITIVQESPICGVILVTTPQQVAVSDVRRSVHMFRRVGVPVLGIIENMSYLLCAHTSVHIPLFGSGGGLELSQELNAPLLGQIPIDSKICEGGDLGIPITIQSPSGAVSQVFMEIAKAIAITFSSNVTELNMNEEL